MKLFAPGRRAAAPQAGHAPQRCVDAWASFGGDAR